MSRANPIVIIALLAVAMLLAACGGSTVTPTSVPATPAPTSAEVETPAPTAETTPRATTASYEFASTAYGYGVTLPAAAVASQALQPWDGEARIDSDGPYTDQVRIPGSILFFVYGAPTDLTTEAYAAQAQAQTAEWHGCPATADAVGKVPVGGTTGELHEFTCQGLLVQKLMVVRDGQGLVLNMLAPPEGETDPRALFQEIVAGISWPA